MSYFDRRYPQSRREHERDLRHDEPRPTDPVPVRFQIPISSALETAILVKGQKDPREAAKLVEQYAQTAVAAARLDDTMSRFMRETANTPQVVAAVKLLGYCEGLCSQEVFGEAVELEVRTRCAALRTALEMPEASHAQA